jgi:hypothetical protein
VKRTDEYDCQEKVVEQTLTLTLTLMLTLTLTPTPTLALTLTPTLKLTLTLTLYNAHRGDTSGRKCPTSL